MKALVLLQQRENLVFALQSPDAAPNGILKKWVAIYALETLARFTRKSTMA